MGSPVIAGDVNVLTSFFLTLQFLVLSPFVLEDQQAILTRSACSALQDTETDEQLLHRFEHEPSRFGVIGAEFSPDESKVLTWGGDGRARLWSSKTGELMRDYAHDNYVYGAKFSKDGEHIITWSRDGKARLFSLINNDPIRVFAHDGGVISARFNSDASRLLTAGLDSQVKLWDLKREKPIRVFIHDGPAMGARFAKEESCIVSWSQDRTARVWNIEENKEVYSFEHDYIVFGCVLARDDTLLVTTTDDEVVMWSLENGEQIQTLRQDGLTRDIFSDGVSFNEDESLFLACGHSEAIRVLDVDDPDLSWELKHEAAVKGGRFLGDGTKVLTWCADGTIQFWQRGEEQPIKTLQGEGPVWGVVVSTDGSKMFTWSNMRASPAIVGEPFVFTAKAMQRDLDNASESRNFEYSGGIRGAVFNADASQILVWTNDRQGGSAILLITAD